MFMYLNDRLVASHSVDDTPFIYAPFSVALAKMAQRLAPPKVNSEIPAPNF